MPSRTLLGAVSARLRFPAVKRKCSCEHKRGRKRPTTSEATIAQQNFLRVLGTDKVAYVSGVGLREIARKLDIPEGTVLAYAKRYGWTQQIQVATQQSGAITPVQSVPESLAAILGKRRDRTKLGLSRFAAEAAEQAAEHRDKLGIAGKVKRRGRCP